jgi:hypothetical protein
MEVCRSGNCVGSTALATLRFTPGAPSIGGMTIQDGKRLRDLEAENNQLKKLLAESLLDAEALKVALGLKH